MMQTSGRKAACSDPAGEVGECVSRPRGLQRAEGKAATGPGDSHLTKPGIQGWDQWVSLCSCTPFEGDAQFSPLERINLPYVGLCRAGSHTSPPERPRPDAVCLMSSGPSAAQALSRYLLST